MLNGLLIPHGINQTRKKAGKNCIVSISRELIWQQSLKPGPHAGSSESTLHFLHSSPQPETSPCSAAAHTTASRPLANLQPTLHPPLRVAPGLHPVPPRSMEESQPVAGCCRYLECSFPRTVPPAFPPGFWKALPQSPSPHAIPGLGRARDGARLCLPREPKPSAEGAALVPLCPQPQQERAAFSPARLRNLPTGKPAPRQSLMPGPFISVKLLNEILQA